MKLSRYNIITKAGDGIIVYNLNSGAVLCLNKKYKEMLEEIRGNNNYLGKEDLIEELKKGKMLIDSDKDELKEVIEESQTTRSCNEIASLTVAPTMECNFICPYCYEKGIKHKTMTQEIITAVKSFIKQMKNTANKLEIIWYGGEPLLVLDIVKELTYEAISVFGTENYTANMVTNGYLLNEQNSSLLESLKINNIQITLDGPPKIHNQRRKLPNNEDTFFVILNNIKRILDENINVHFNIRINTDKKNIDSIDEILEYIDKFGLKGKIELYLAPVHDMNNKCNNPTCLSNKEFAKEEFAFIKRSLNKGYNLINLPERNPGICGAVSNNCFVIDASGNIFKCLGEISQPQNKIGNVLHHLDKNNDKLKKWTSYQLDSVCLECNYLPVCMGGCPAFQMKRAEKRCIPIKEYCSQMIGMIYDYAK